MHPVKPYKNGLGAFERFSNYSNSADRLYTNELARVW